MIKGVKKKIKDVDKLTAIQGLLVVVMVLLSASLVYNIGGDLKEVRSVGEQEMVKEEQLAKHQEAINNGESVFKEEDVNLVGMITIPEIGVHNSVVLGTSEEKLKNSVGVLEGSDVPLGRDGEMSIIVGHRGYVFRNRFFWGLDRLEKGNTILLEMEEGKKEYEVISKGSMSEDDVEDLENTEDDSKLVLVTSPRFGDKGTRVVVIAKLNR